MDPMLIGFGVVAFYSLVIWCGWRWHSLKQQRPQKFHHDLPQRSCSINGRELTEDEWVSVFAGESTSNTYRQNSAPGGLGSGFESAVHGERVR